MFSPSDELTIFVSTDYSFVKMTLYCLNSILFLLYELMSHPALRRRVDIAATSLCTSQQCRRYVSNETPNDVSMEHGQDLSVVRLCDLLLERHNDV